MNRHSKRGTFQYVMYVQQAEILYMNCVLSVCRLEAYSTSYSARRSLPIQLIIDELWLFSSKFD